MRVFKALSDGFPLVSIDGEELVIDTGATHSIGHPRGCRFIGDRSSPMGGLMGGLWDSVASCVQGHTGASALRGLVGADLLSKTGLYYDGRLGLVGLGVRNGPHSRTKLEFESCFGLPVLTVDFGGQTKRLVLDTGADCGFLIGPSPSHFRPGQTIHDSHPLAGEFTSKTWVGDIVVKAESGADVSINAARFGTLPPLLQLSVSMAGVDGVLGNDFFMNNAVQIAPGFGSIEVISDDVHEGLGAHYDAMFADLYGQTIDACTSRMVEFILSRWSQGSVLDVGAGTGRLTVPLASSGAHVTAIEPASAMVSELCRKVATAQADVDVHLGGVLEVRLENDAYDVVVMAFGVVDYIHDDEQLIEVLKAIGASSASDGVLLMQSTPEHFFESTTQKGADYTREHRLHRSGEKALIEHTVSFRGEIIDEEQIIMKPRSKTNLAHLALKAGWSMRETHFVDLYPTVEFAKT